MPIHFYDRDITEETAGLKSALIVPCNMCPAVTVAVRQKKPFLRLFRSLIKSAPFEEYIKELQFKLGQKGITTEVFRSSLYHQWFMCMWTLRRQKMLRKSALLHEAVIVLGCESATETVRDAVKELECKVIEGMKVSGIMNAKLRLQMTGNISFEECRTIPIQQ